MQKLGVFVPYKENLSKSLKELKILPEPHVDGHQHINFKLNVEDGSWDGWGKQSIETQGPACPT